MSEQTELMNASLSVKERLAILDSKMDRVMEMTGGKADSATMSTAINDLSTRLLRMEAQREYTLRLDNELRTMQATVQKLEISGSQQAQQALALAQKLAETVNGVRRKMAWWGGAVAVIVVVANTFLPHVKLG